MSTITMTAGKDFLEACHLHDRETVLAYARGAEVSPMTWDGSQYVFSITMPEPVPDTPPVAMGGAPKVNHDDVEADAPAAPCVGAVPAQPSAALVPVWWTLMAGVSHPAAAATAASAGVMRASHDGGKEYRAVPIPAAIIGANLGPGLKRSGVPPQGVPSAPLLLGCLPRPGSSRGGGGSGGGACTRDRRDV